MGKYFAPDWHGAPFQLFEVPHLVALAVVVVLNLGLLRFRRSGERVRARVRLVMVAAMWTQELGWHLWNVTTGQWSVRNMLPLHLCSAMVWLSGIMLLTKSRRLYELSYFLGIGGALQALLTPDLKDYNFPHYRFFETFFAHTMIVTAAMFMTFVEGFRPTWRALGRTLLIATGYGIAVFAINTLLGSNYLFINEKPPFKTLLDALPPWPAYLPILWLIAVVISVVLYLPWVIFDWLNKDSA